MSYNDTSREFESGSNQNRLRKGDIKRILDTYRQRESVNKYAYLAGFDEIKENDFNLNIPRYVDTFEEEEEIDLPVIQREISALELELAGVQRRLAAYLEELKL